MRTLLRLYYTLRPLKWRQLFYLVYYPLKRRFARRERVAASVLGAIIGRPTRPLSSLNEPRCFWPEKRSFRFLNKEKTFSEKIDWEFAEHGALWAFQLNYFEWLADDALTSEARLEAMLDFVNSSRKKTAHLPYPTSLRILAWARFLTRFPEAPNEVYEALAADVYWLNRFPEFQLDGNHLWENGLALLVGGIFLGKDELQKRGEQILSACIREQILEDGGHAEGSPMYQSLLLWRLLQGIELIEILATEEAELLTFLKVNAGKMLSWLQRITFSDGSWPMVNDSAIGVAPDTKTLAAYAKNLGIPPSKIPLSTSGYRFIKFGHFELFVDAAPIQPSYQPGHSHADTGNFCLHINGQPIIVDTGVSTYEPGSTRSYERSSAAHNVMTIGSQNSSDVWKSFRVGRRAEIVSFSETKSSISLSHNGFPALCSTRIFSWSGDALILSDEIIGSKNVCVYGWLHFHPAVDLTLLDVKTVKAGQLVLSFEFENSIELFYYNYANGFNNLISARGIRYTITKNTTGVKFKLA